MGGQSVPSCQRPRHAPVPHAGSPRAATVLTSDSADSLCLVSSFTEMGAHSRCSLESGFPYSVAMPLGAVVHSSFCTVCTVCVAGHGGIAREVTGAAFTANRNRGRLSSRACSFIHSFVRHSLVVRAHLPEGENPPWAEALRTFLASHSGK